MQPEACDIDVKPETKRDRVRRLFIGPMTDLGWRKPGDVKAEDHARNLTRLADDLAYLSDEGFARLRAGLRHKGCGKGRDAWPPNARIVAFADIAEPRPIEDLPALLRWFRSRAGAEADAAGRLVEEYRFWCRHKRPPVALPERRAVAEMADRNRRRADLIAERAGMGRAVDAEDHHWLRAYQDELYRLRRIVAESEGSDR